jgi:DNA-binding NtrC family response regulator
VDGPRGPGADGFRAFIQRTEAALIAAALADAGWNKAEAARQLDLPLRTLKDKVQAHRIDPAFEIDRELLGALERMERTTPPAPGAGFWERIRGYEAALIAWALEQYGGRRGAAARRLKIPARTLRDKVSAYGLG